MWSSPFVLTYKLAYTIAVIVLFIGSMASLAGNGDVRSTVLSGDFFGKDLLQVKKQSEKR